MKSDGVVVHRRDYDAWGEVTKETGTALHPFGYAGGLYDGATGLVRFGARDYDPSLGRWLAKDPIGFGGGFGLYSYTYNNPLDYVDSTGAIPIPVLVALGAGGIAAGAGSYAAQKFAGGPVDYGDVAIAAVVGVAATGLGLASAPLGWGGVVALNAGAGALQYTATERYHCRSLTYGGLGQALFFGGISGPLGGRISKPAETLSSSLKTSIREYSLAQYPTYGEYVGQYLGITVAGSTRALSAGFVSNLSTNSKEKLTPIFP